MGKFEYGVSHYFAVSILWGHVLFSSVSVWGPFITYDVKRLILVNYTNGVIDYLQGASMDGAVKYLPSRELNESNTKDFTAQDMGHGLACFKKKRKQIIPVLFLLVKFNTALPENVFKK